MRISDWSSDVCSSDLRDVLARHLGGAKRHDLGRFGALDGQVRARRDRQPRGVLMRGDIGGGDRDFAVGGVGADEERSEEHTSELPSLMRTSYAVFCLKKKTTQT